MDYYNRTVLPFFFCLFSSIKAADHLILVSSEGKEVGISRDVVELSSVLQKCKPREFVDFSAQQFALLGRLATFQKDCLQQDELTNESINQFKQLFPADKESYYAHHFEIADFFNLSSIRNLLVEQATSNLDLQNLKEGYYTAIEMAYSPKFIAMLEHRLQEKRELASRGKGKDCFAYKGDKR